MLFRSSTALLFKRAATIRPMMVTAPRVTTAVKTARPSIALLLPTMIDRSVDRYHQPNHHAVSASDCVFNVATTVPFCIPTGKKEAFAAVGPADFDAFAMLEGTHNCLLQLSKDEETCASEGKEGANYPKGDSARTWKPVVGIKAAVPLNSATEVGNHDDPSHASGDHYSNRSSKLMTAPRAIPFRSANTWDPLAVQASPASKIQEGGQQKRMFSTGPSDSPPEPKRSGTGAVFTFSDEDCADMAFAGCLSILGAPGLAWAYYFLFAPSRPWIETPFYATAPFSLVLIAYGAPGLAIFHIWWYCLLRL